MPVEPISLTAFVTSIVANSVKVITQLHNIRETYKSAPQLFGHLYSETTSVQKLLVDFHARCVAAVDDRTRSEAEDNFTAANNAEHFRRIVEAVNSTLYELQARIARFDVRDLPSEKPKSGDVFKYIWDEKEIDKLVQQLQHHKLTLSVTLSMFADRLNEDNRKILLKLLDGQQRLRQQLDRSQLQIVRGLHTPKSDGELNCNRIISAETARSNSPFPARGEHIERTTTPGVDAPSELPAGEIPASHRTLAAVLPRSSAFNTSHTNPSEPLTQIERLESDGSTAYSGKEWSQAAQLLKRAVEGRERFGSDADSIAATRTLYAKALYMDKQYDLAREQFEQLVQWAETKFGRDHLETAKARRSLAYATEAWGSSSVAREQFKQAALGFERAQGGADSLDSLRCRYRHGVVAAAHEPYDRDWAHWDEAEESLRRAAEALPRFLVAKDDECFDAEVAYATVLLHTCQDRQAHVRLQQCLKTARDRGLPRDHAQVKSIKSLIEECSYWLKHPKKAQSADRMQISRERAAQRAQHEGWRVITGHW